MKSMVRVWTLTSLAFLATTITAVAATATVALTVNPTDAGKVTGGGVKTVGTTDSLTATASNGWKFVNWSDGTNTASRKVLVPSNGVALTANFTVSTGILSITPTNLDFGNAPISLTTSQAVTLANSGPGSISVSGMTFPSGFSTTPTSFTIASGATRRVYIVFKPTSTTTSYGGKVKFTSNAARVPGGLTLAGRGVAQTRIVRLDGNLAFGEVLGGLTNTLPVTVYNDGNSPMSITAVTWSNNTATAFSAKPTAFTVPAGASNTMNVIFAPKTTAVWNATLVLTVTSLTGGTRSILATGSGRQLQIVLTVDPPGAGKVTGAGAYNAGATASLKATASNGWRFASWSDGPTNATRTLVVPPNDVALTASFVSTNVSPGLRIIRLDGNLNFGEHLTEQTTTLPLTIYNDGTNSMIVDSASWANNADASFSTSPAGFTIQPGTSAVMTVSFTPKAAQLYTNLVLTLNVPGLTSGTNSIAVSGGASAWANGTWTATLSGAPISSQNVTAYIWQDGTNVVAEIKGTYATLLGSGSIDSLFSGTIQNRTNITGAFWYSGGSVPTNFTLFYSTGQVSPKIVSGTIPVSANGSTYKIIATLYPRTSTNISASLPQPVTLTIASAYGRGTPRAGYYVYHNGAVLTNTMSGVQAAGGTQYVAAGWTMTGNDPASGSDTTMVMTQTNNAVLTWLWSTNYALTATIDTNAVVAGGSVTGDANGWYAAGASVTVTAVPDTGYHFAGWVGDTTGDTNSLSQPLTMDQARTLVAYFAPDDPTPVARPKPTATSAASSVVSPTALAPPSLILTVLATADGEPLACAPDGRCAVLETRAGVATVVFPAGIKPLTSVPVIVLQTVGPDANANGLPDNMDAVLGRLPPEGTELLTVRVVDGWLLLDTPYRDKLRIEGAAVPCTQIPASWQVSPVGQ